MKTLTKTQFSKNIRVKSFTTAVEEKSQNIALGRRGSEEGSACATLGCKCDE